MSGRLAAGHKTQPAAGATTVGFMRQTLLCPLVRANPRERSALLKFIRGPKAHGAPVRSNFHVSPAPGIHPPAAIRFAQDDFRIGLAQVAVCLLGIGSLYA
ncbi:MAG: hypothetical protein C4297_08460 [Gemmataceae bacterium]